jgi:putative addiction module antidote
MGQIPKELEGEALVLQVRKIGNSVGVIFPKELLNRLRLKEGDSLHVIEQPERNLKLTPYDPKHAQALALARKAFQDYGDTFRELAK